MLNSCNYRTLFPLGRQIGNNGGRPAGRQCDTVTPSVRRRDKNKLRKAEGEINGEQKRQDTVCACICVRIKLKLLIYSTTWKRVASSTKQT